jgi:tryptophan-rich sensory protein
VRRALPIVAFVLLCLAVGWVSGLTTEAAIVAWYRPLAKPSWTPPDAAFPIAWTILYVLMGIAAGLVWTRRHRGRRRAIGWFLIQLALNVLWSPVFFGLHSPAGGLAVILLLLAALVATLVAFFAISRAAFWLLVPYLLWVGYATTLAIAICALNP